MVLGHPLQGWGVERGPVGGVRTGSDYNTSCRGVSQGRCRCLCSVNSVHILRDYSKSFGCVGSCEGFHQVGGSGRTMILRRGTLFVTGMHNLSDHGVSF